MLELKELLKQGAVTVKFKKADGSDRFMLCTLVPDLLPSRELLEGVVSPVRKVNDEVYIVYDLEKQAWRSFRLDSVIDYFV